MFGEHSFEFLVIGLYFLLMLVMGIVFRRYISNFSDYFRSGCRATWWLVGASAFMASFSAWTFTGAAGVAYTSGISVAIIFFANTAGYVFNALLTAPWFRQLRAITHPEVIYNRYNRFTQQLYVWFGTVPAMLTGGLTLVGVAIFTSAVFDMNIKLVIIVLGSVITIYSAIGGSWSVMATDFLQTLILMPMAILVAILSLKAIGGPVELFNSVQTAELGNMLRLVEPEGTYNWGFAVAMFMFVMLTYNSILGHSKKYFSCKDGKDASKAAWIAGALMLVGSLLWFIPPIVARLLYADEVAALAGDISKPAEASYAIISIKLLPAGFTGLIVVAMFTATMSSLDTALNHAAAIISQDVYKPFIRKSASDKELFIVGQIWTVVTGVIITCSALYFASSDSKGIFEYMLMIGSLVGTPMAVPMFLAIFFRRVPSWSAVFSIGAGFSVSLVAFIAEKQLFTGFFEAVAANASYGWLATHFLEAWSYEKKVISICIVGSAAFFATIPFWKNETDQYKEKVRKFFTTMHTPVDFEKEVGGEMDGTQLQILGSVTAVVGFMIGWISLLPNTTAARIQIWGVALSIMLCGIGMLIPGFRAKRRKKLETGNPPTESEPVAEEAESA